MQHIIDYMRKFHTRPVSPVWGGYVEFPFLCLGHLDISRALGFELKQETPVLTVVKEGQIRSMEELDDHILTTQPDRQPMQSESDSLKWMKKEYPDKPCGGGCFGPLTVVSGILGAENLLRLSVKNPELVEKFVAYVTEYLIELAGVEREAGGDFFWIAEPVASLFSPRLFWRYSGQYLQKIYDSCGVPGFLHVCGKTIRHTSYMIQTGAEVLSIDYCTDIGECIRQTPANVVIMGNISPINLRWGTKEEVTAEVKEVLKAVEGYPNFIMSTGCATIEDTPEENMQVLFDLCADALVPWGTDK